MRTIDADALRAHISELMLVYGGTELDCEILNAIDNAPTVTVEEWVEAMSLEDIDLLRDALTPKGKWLFKEITDDNRVYGQCSICKQRKRIDNFCPNCGARMGR